MSAPAIEIRSASVADIPLVQMIAHAVWHAHYPAIVTLEQIRYMLARGYTSDLLGEFVREPHRGIELALIDGRPAAFAAWMCISKIEAKLDKLYVLPSWQRVGVGGRLIRYVAGLAHHDGARTLVLNVNKRNVQAIRAYHKHGFAIRDAVVNDIGGGFVMDDYVMAMTLS